MGRHSTIVPRNYSRLFYSPLTNRGRAFTRYYYRGMKRNYCASFEIASRFMYTCGQLGDVTMTKSDIARLRLANQHISNPSFKKPSDVVEWLGAVQAQDYAGAKWALGLRMQRATDRVIDQAFTDGSILRTHLMRPTWHFVAPTDIRWLLALTAPRVHAVNATMYRTLELDRATCTRSNAALAKVLRGGQQLTRDELRRVLENAGIAAENGLRLAYLMMYAELEGLICSGARRGKQFTYALVDERAPHAKTLKREEALAELARRYFTSRAPASVQDYAKWSGLTIADAQRGLEAVRPRLVRELVDGQTLWRSNSSSSENQTAPSAHLLSIYDEYISGYKDRSAIGTAEVGVKLIALGNALNSIIVIDGQIVGVWRRTFEKKKVVIEMNLYVPLTKAEKDAVAAAAGRYAKFLEMPLVMKKRSGSSAVKAPSE